MLKASQIHVLVGKLFIFAHKGGNFLPSVRGTIVLSQAKENASPPGACRSGGGACRRGSERAAPGKGFLQHEAIGRPFSGERNCSDGHRLRF
jgi:hypothetical protein